MRGREIRWFRVLPLDVARVCCGPGGTGGSCVSPARDGPQSFYETEHGHSLLVTIIGTRENQTLNRQSFAKIQ